MGSEAKGHAPLDGDVAKLRGEQIRAEKDDVPRDVWLVWGHSCYHDHAVEAVTTSEGAAVDRARSLTAGDSDPRNAYDHEGDVEYSVEHFEQRVSE